MPAGETAQCENSLEMIVGLDAKHNTLHVSGLVQCYEENGYNYCSPEQMDDERKTEIMDTCEIHVRDFIGAVAGMGGHSELDWVDNLFAKELERDARRTGTRGSTRTRSTRTFIPSECLDFSSRTLLSFFNALAMLLTDSDGRVMACTDDGTPFGTCLFQVFRDVILLLFSGSFGRCFLFLLG